MNERRTLGSLFIARSRARGATALAYPRFGLALAACPLFGSMPVACAVLSFALAGCHARGSPDATRQTQTTRAAAAEREPALLETRAGLLDGMGAPECVLAVEGGLELFAWTVEQTFPELEPPRFHVVALLEGDAVLWLERLPPALHDPSRAEARAALRSLLADPHSPAERRAILRAHGMLAPRER